MKSCKKSSAFHLIPFIPFQHALVRRRKLKKLEKRDHWLEYADDTYEKTLIDDTKATLRVLFLYLPLPFFWALFDQQVSMLV
jgi:solute carrier family 15 oligopeptide transporter 1